MPHLAGQLVQEIDAGDHIEFAVREGQLLRRALNQFTRRATVCAVASDGDAVVTLVAETIRSWDAETVTGRLEAAVGRDLQYIRINGTLVGGLVGLTIHLIDVLS